MKWDLPDYAYYDSKKWTVILLLLFNATWVSFHLKSKTKSAKFNEILRKLWKLYKKIQILSHITSQGK